MGSAQMAEHFNRRLLFPIPHSPKTAKDGVLPVASPWRSARRKASICAFRPTNSSGLTGKFGPGITAALLWNKSYKWNCSVCSNRSFFCSVGWHDEQRQDTSPIVRSGWCCEVDFSFLRAECLWVQFRILGTRA